MPTEAILGNTGRCIFPMTLLFTKNSISPRVTWAIRFLKQSLCQDRGTDLLGSMVSGSSKDHIPDGSRNSFLSDRHWLVHRQDLPTNEEQYNAWQTIQRSHAVANGVHVVSVNRVGFEQEGAMKFWGGSFIANPFRTNTIPGPADKEEVLCRKWTRSKTDSYRTHWPFMRDRRIDSYQPITKSL